MKTENISAPTSSRSLVTELDVSGMTCANCARHVTQALQSVEGVAHAEVSLEENRARVRWRPQGAEHFSELAQAVKAAGYSAKLIENQESKVPAKKIGSGWRFNAIIGTSCLVPLLIGEWIFQAGMEPWFHWFSFALASVVQIFCGAKFYRGSWNQLKAHSSNMDTLVALGSTTAFLYSAWGLFSHLAGHLYFMEAAGIITLVSVGHWLENIAAAKASGSLKSLLTLAPQTARRRDSRHSTETDVPVSELQIGDVVVLKPGDRVPTDGQLTEGHSTIDEAMLTGESLPVDKKIGDELYAGTVNLTGQIFMRITATGE
ncbi:MAG: heavy metal translocating P-type ATPase, partial [Limisphaerales bacterium]